MNNKIIISIVFMLLVTGCKDKEKKSNLTDQSYSQPEIDSVIVANKDTVSIVKKKEVLEQEVNKTVPDTIINNKLFLENYESLPKFYSDYKNIQSIDRIRQSPVVIFNNKSKTQYLLAYHYEGASKNSFSCLEIGYLVDDNKVNNKLAYTIDDDEFKTESDIGLGISFDKLIKIKGDNYTTQKKNEEIIITYRIDNYDSSPFLQRYNMPSYFMAFRVKADKVVKITFGFDYP